MKRRHLILLLGGASSGAMSVGTGAFSSVEAERGVSVNVVEDGEAYLGLEQVNKYLPVDGGNAQTVESEEYEPNDVVRIQNQFSDPLDLTVTVESTEGVVSEDSVDIDDRLAGDGELESVTRRSSPSTVRAVAKDTSNCSSMGRLTERPSKRPERSTCRVSMSTSTAETETETETETMVAEQYTYRVFPAL